MPSTTLLDNLNSDLLAALTALSPRGAAQRVLVYVESDEDVAFWRGVLSPFEKPHNIAFDIQLPFKNALEKGKTAALSKSTELLTINGLGPNMIICVDSDYDYLLQQKTTQSRQVNHNDFVFQTYTYSIENLLCYSESLHLLCTQASKNDERIIDFEELMKLYSKIIHPLFLWSIHFSFQEDSISFPISDFCTTAKLEGRGNPSDRFQSLFEKLQSQVMEKVNDLETRFPSEIENVAFLSDELADLGLQDDNTYLFSQGHLIQDNVVLPLLRSVYSQLKTKKEQEIRTRATTSTEQENQRNHYLNQIIPIENVLKTNTNFKSCFLYLKIEADLTQYIGRLKAST